MRLTTKFLSDMKQCVKCNRELPLTDFYKHPNMASGYLNKCKKCHDKQTSAHYQENRERHNEYSRAWRHKHLSERRVAERRHQQRDRERWPEKHKARSTLTNAIRAGKISRGACERCGNFPAHGHHEDYSKPLDVIWLCRPHHAERHRELREQGIQL